jgi:hypothetical protein
MKQGALWERFLYRMSMASTADTYDFSFAAIDGEEFDEVRMVECLLKG